MSTGTQFSLAQPRLDAFITRILGFRVSVLEPFSEYANGVSSLSMIPSSLDLLRVVGNSRNRCRQRNEVLRLIPQSLALIRSTLLSSIHCFVVLYFFSQQGVVYDNCLISDGAVDSPTMILKIISSSCSH